MATVRGAGCRHPAATRYWGRGLAFAAYPRHMNIAAATGTRTYALFGANEPFDHASQVVPIISSDTGEDDGMWRMTVAAVLNTIQGDRGRLSL